MKYLTRTSCEELRKNYDVLVGWGNSVVEFERYYNPTLYKLDYLINGEGKDIGEKICGLVLSDASVLEELKDKKVCVIIYPNVEDRLLEQINKFLPNADTIVGRLVDTGKQYNYSSDCEDTIFMDLINKLNYSNDFSYMDIGVCHPVIRNNTYMLYEKGFTNGVLVEPNPIMAQSASNYRPGNKVINVGACGGKDSVLPYVSGTCPGLNHFLRENEEVDKETTKVMNIPVRNINDIIAENFEKCPDLLDIDTEGMDYELLSALDTERYPIKIICAEVSKKHNIRELMQSKGYVHFTSTRENKIFILESEYNKLIQK